VNSRNYVTSVGPLEEAGRDGRRGNVASRSASPSFLQAISEDKRTRSFRSHSFRSAPCRREGRAQGMTSCCSKRVGWCERIGSKKEGKERDRDASIPTGVRSPPRPSLLSSSCNLSSTATNPSNQRTALLLRSLLFPDRERSNREGSRPRFRSSNPRPSPRLHTNQTPHPYCLFLFLASQSHPSVLYKGDSNSGRTVTAQVSTQSESSSGEGREREREGG
jgi:hypothetical protein